MASITSSISINPTKLLEQILTELKSLVSSANCDADKQVEIHEAIQEITNR